MLRTRIIGFAAAVMCILCLATPAKAVQIDCSSVYCFSAEDFSDSTPVTGICITGVPDKTAGTLLLGTRVIQQGDILTAEQAAQMTFVPVNTYSDNTAEVMYLPVYESKVAPCSTMTISIRGKEDKAPVAEDSSTETYKNLENSGKLKVSDPEGQAMTYTVIRQPKRGTVTIAEDGSFTYSPKKNKVGIDSFTYTATDPAGNVSREATVTVTILKPSDSTQYTDTAGRDCRFSAEWMRHSGIFTGERIGDQVCFQPDKEVTRAEFIAMLVKTLDIPTEEQLTYTGYSDEIPGWLQPYLAAAVRSGLTDGLPNQDVFGINCAVSGAEAAVMLQNALDLTGAHDVVSPEDTDSFRWAVSAMTAAEENGFALDAQKMLTREEASLVLYRSAQIANAATIDTLV